VRTLRLQVEKGIECYDAIDTSKRNIQLQCDVLEGTLGKILIWIVVLNAFENAEECAGPVLVRGNYLVHVVLVFHDGLHRDS
jgi:hypothetical protein